MDDADRAQAQAEWFEQYQQQHRRKHVMRANDFCQDCGEVIEPERLKAVPTATRCWYCQNDKEAFDSRYAE